MISRHALRAMDRDAYMAAFAGVFEHSSWVAEAGWASAPFEDVEQLQGAMVAAVEMAGPESQLALVRAHPDLAVKPAEREGLTAKSRGEQAGASLDQCTPEEFARFAELNRAYREKFGFPFIMAVRGHGRTAILAAFEERVGNEPVAEFEHALAEIARIAQFRLRDLVED